MHKDEIADLLEEKYHMLISFLEDQEDEKWTQGPEDKWTSGQQALHLLKSIIPLNNILSMPRFLFKLFFGKTNAQLRDYDTIIKSYHEQLQKWEGKTIKGSKNLRVPKIQDKNYILTRLQVESKKLQYKIRRISDKNLDTLVLPHAVMGKMPIREILMLNTYHVEYHTKQLKEKY